MPAKKYMTWAAAAFVAFYVIREPDRPARSVGRAAGGLASAAGSLSTFVNALA
ncbi:hypothetical protein AGRA3207_004185 [Actinomadura graeca]|uniref:Secreted protein n=1 Tax=Actinomadura graeca TaxID=2750812 RepID=A0ABX8R7J0_9ACTN|nr:hypothetical protein [Actinomadura graeca]QXJ27046.1 hypothetical protein AGRA3207_004185 [Actinomadura graeca]